MATRRSLGRPRCRARRRSPPRCTRVPRCPRYAFSTTSSSHRSGRHDTGFGRMPPGPRFVRFRAWLARGLGALTRAERISLAIGVPTYLAVHRVYAVRVFGEDDAANFVTDAIF